MPPNKTPPKAGRGALKVDYWPIGKVKPSRHNPKTHSPAQIDAIVASIQSPVGWTKPIIVDEKGEILAGHGAYQAALQIGMVEVPVIARAGLTSAQKRAYRIADNKLAEKSEWDQAVLAEEFKALTAAGFDVSLTGFDPNEIEFMLAPPPQTLDDPPVPKIERRAVSKLGDLWLLGHNRLICGDSTDPKTYKALMGGRQAQCVFTDPPYGVTYQGLGLGKLPVLENDDLRRGDLKKMLHAAFTHAKASARQDAGWYVWHADKTREDFATAMRDVGLVELGMIIWEKTASMGWQDYRNAHEPCFYAAHQGVKPAFYGDRTGTTVWRLEPRAGGANPASLGTGIVVVGPDGRELYVTAKAPKGKKLRHVHAKEGEAVLVYGRSDVDDVWAVSRDAGHGKDDAIHPTMKPVELARRACNNSAQEGDVVLDMFAGSSSTLMAAEQTRRHGYGIELDPKYVDAGVRRWQDMTGKEAIHAVEKKPFSQIAKARGKA